MAYKKDIKPWLKENGYTMEEMDALWEKCCEFNFLCKNFKNEGKSWTDLNMHLIKQLPTLEERTKQHADEKAEQEAEEKRLAEEEAKRAEYYSKHFEELMVAKIDSDEPLTERELRTLVFEYEVESEDGEAGRWTQCVCSVCKLCDRYFNVTWFRGLTEMQENEYMEQPYEVVRQEKVVTETRTEWVEKDSVQTDAVKPLYIPLAKEYDNAIRSMTRQDMVKELKEIIDYRHIKDLDTKELVLYMALILLLDEQN